MLQSYNNKKLILVPVVQKKKKHLVENKWQKFICWKWTQKLKDKKKVKKEGEKKGLFSNKKERKSQKKKFYQEKSPAKLSLMLFFVTLKKKNKKNNQMSPTSPEPLFFPPSTSWCIFPKKGKTKKRESKLIRQKLVQRPSPPQALAPRMQNPVQEKKKKKKETTTRPDIYLMSG